MALKIRHFHNFPRILLRLSEHGDVIETETTKLYLCDMHNNMNITQTRSPGMNRNTGSCSFCTRCVYFSQ